MNQHMEPLPNHPAQFHGDLIDQGKCYVYPQNQELARCRGLGLASMAQAQNQV